MADAHSKGIVFRDIKNRNFVVSSDKGMVRFIDLDDVETPDTGYFNGRTGTRQYYTAPIHLGKKDGDLDLIKCGDNYAMLLTICEGTGLKLGRNDGRYNNGILNSSNEDRFKGWVGQQIQPEYRQATLDFLRTIHPKTSCLFHCIK